MKFNYYYGSEAEQFTFIRVPKAIVKNPEFKDLSNEAKLLYGILLDRMSLSIKNGWFDELNRAYIIYQITEIMDDMGLTKKMAMKYLSELEDFGLVEKRRRGLGKPNLIYVMNFTIERDYSNRNIQENTEQNSEIPRENAGTSRSVDLGTSGGAYMGTSRGVDLGTSRSVEMGTSRGADLEPQEVPTREPINNTYKSDTNINNNYINNTNQSDKSNLILSSTQDETKAQDEIRLEFSPEREAELYRHLIKRNIEFDCLVERYPHEQPLIEGIVDLIVETIVSKNDYIVIASDKYPKELVKSKFCKLDFTHIEYVLTCMANNTTKVKNIKKYLLAALFNSPTTINSYYHAEVNHDMPELTRNYFST